MRRLPLLVALVLAGVTLGADGPKQEKLDGYAEFLDGDALVVDGQRLVLTPSTKVKRKGVPPVSDVLDVPPGAVVEAKGTRRDDGALVATEVELKVNDTALFEREVLQATEEMESRWMQSGRVFELDANGREQDIGRVVDEGPDVRRTERILNRLLPQYVDRGRVRLHVVDTKAWNAMAMGNGAVWVFTGLLHDMDDDEVAIVLGHELVHFTHEHSRKGFKRDFIVQLIAAGALAAAEAVDSRKTKEVIGLATIFSFMALTNGYGRDLEDQADRVGLRYAYQAGYDVRKGPRLWQRFSQKYGDRDPFTNFFFSDHSRSSARVRNLEREIALNYPSAGATRRDVR